MTRKKNIIYYIIYNKQNSISNSPKLGFQNSKKERIFDFLLNVLSVNIIGFVLSNWSENIAAGALSIPLAFTKNEHGILDILYLTKPIIFIDVWEIEFLLYLA